MRSFVCRHLRSSRRYEKWDAFITDIVQHEAWCEFFIESRSNLHVFVGKGKVGRFVSIPDWRTSCWINDPADLSFNKGKLGKLMRNTVDGTTVAYALQNIADLLP
jgi:hypothetical protein